MTASHYQQRSCRCPMLLPPPCAPVPCCMPRRAVPPRRGTQLIPHSHVQSTQPHGATHMLGARSALAAFTTVDTKTLAK